MRCALGLALLVLSVVGVGCEWSDNSPGSDRAAGLHGAAGAQAAAGETPSDPFQQGAERRARPELMEGPDRTVTWTQRVGEQVAEEEQAEPERDLSAELHQAMGDPSRCAPAGAELPSSFAVNVNVNVSLTGTVTRSQVSGPGLPAAMITCLRGRAESVRFASPVPDAPIRARLEVERQGPPPTKTVETVRVPVAAGFELQRGQDTIAGQGGTEIQAQPSIAIQAAPSVPPPAPSGTPISPSVMGVPISGPSGRPIGQ